MKDSALIVGVHDDVNQGVARINLRWKSHWAAGIDRRNGERRGRACGFH
jgi:hypothetical protein